jgi:Fe-S-cluster containining protein
VTSSEIKLSKTLEDGIEFSCLMCGDCCRGFNDGEVYLYKDDILKLANHLNLKGKVGLREFARKYIKVINDSFFWKKPGAERGKTYKFKTLGFRFMGDDEHCQFLKNNQCSVHESRPFQCRCFPFWQIMVSNTKNFYNYSKKCPGLRELKGKFYSKEKILEWAQAEYTMEKKYFLKMKKTDFDILKVYPFLPKELLEED